jgi:hypothetical protein
MRLELKTKSRHATAVQCKLVIVAQCCPEDGFQGLKSAMVVLTKDRRIQFDL